MSLRRPTASNFRASAGQINSGPARRMTAHHHFWRAGDRIFFWHCARAGVNSILFNPVLFTAGALAFLPIRFARAAG
jgi:hypothetical protein